MIICDQRHTGEVEVGCETEICVHVGLYPGERGGEILLMYSESRAFDDM
jgi:hypothetical protein